MSAVDPRDANRLWLPLFVSHVLVTLASIPITLMFGVWVLMAESGGKKSRPFVIPFLIWGVAEMAWTLVMIARRRTLAASPRQKAGGWLRGGLALTFLLFPGSIIGGVLFGGGSEWSLLVPYGFAVFGCRMTRHALASPAQSAAHLRRPSR